MGNLLSDLLAYPHPMLNHFVIALLIVSVVLDLWGRWNPAMRYTAWVTLVLGTLDHHPYRHHQDSCQCSVRDDSGDGVH